MLHTLIFDFCLTMAKCLWRTGSIWPAPYLDTSHAMMVRSNYVWKYYIIILRVQSLFLYPWITFLWYVCTSYWYNVTATFRSRLLLRRNFITSQSVYLLAQMISFSDDVRITLNYGNCWNVGIAYGIYVIKWS